MMKDIEWTDTSTLLRLYSKDDSGGQNLAKITVSWMGD